MALCEQSGLAPGDLRMSLPTSTVQGFPHPLVLLDRKEVEDLEMLKTNEEMKLSSEEKGCWWWKGGLVFSLCF